MTEILVFSDSHGSLDDMKNIIRANSPDMVIHAGDYSYDSDELRAEFPELTIAGVRGNCDRFSAAPELLRFEECGKKFFVAHGHNYGVKDSIDRICYAALEAQADILIYGHTHIPFYDRRLAIDIINPGSIGRGARRSYGVIRLEEGKLPDIKIIYL